MVTNGRIIYRINCGLYKVKKGSAVQEVKKGVWVQMYIFLPQYAKEDVSKFQTSDIQVTTLMI